MHVRPLGALTATALSASALALTLAPTATAAPTSTVFFNEIHYDNAGTDTGEFLEIANTGGTDLAGWSVVLYNGANGQSYDTVTLSGSDPYVVIDLPTNGLQNGSPDGLAIVRPDDSVEQFLSYEGTFTATDGLAAGLTSQDIGVEESGSTPVGFSLQLLGDGPTYADRTWQAEAPETKGADNNGTGPSGPLELEIAEVQGSGATSDYVGQQVRVSGVVTADFQEPGQFGGFFLQDPTPDADPLTSDGIRVFNTTPVSVGDAVTVTGTVAEFTSSGNLYSGSETQFGPAATVTITGTAPVPAPLEISLPFALPSGGVDGQERYEGVLVTLVNDDLVATDLFTTGRFGEVGLTTGSPLVIPTSVAEDAANNADRIVLDDGLSGQNLSPLPYTIGGDGLTLPRSGDRPTDTITGAFSYAFGEYRIEPPVGTTIDFAGNNPRPDTPDAVGGDVQVASFNVLNYFTTFGGDARGADNPAELARQQAKLVAAITGLDADVVGLIEIANDGGEALDTLVAALNAAQPDASDAYTAVVAPDLTAPNSLGGTYGTDAIRTALIYRDAVVDLLEVPSDEALLNPADLPDFPDEPVFDRPPAVATFVADAKNKNSTSPFTVFVNHFKSKGSNNPQCGTPDPFGGNCDDLRERQSAALLGLVEDLGVTDAILLGDLNAYEAEEPISVLTDAGFVNAAAGLADGDRYSYSFDGEYGTLDYAFLSPSLAGALAGSDIWHINSPEAVAYDYNDFNQPQLYAPDAFASSDHDPVLLGLDLVVHPGRPGGRPCGQGHGVSGAAGTQGPTGAQKPCPSER